MRKQNKLFLSLLVGISILFLIPLFKTGIPATHDGEAQVVRITAFYKAISDNQFPPRWAGDLNYRYGLPTLNFFFPLEGYLGTVFHSFGISLQDSYKLQLIASFVCAPLFFFLWASQLFKKEVAFVGSLLYGFAPYHFLDLYVRGQLAELLAFVFIPLIFFFVERNSKKFSYPNLVGGGISHALLILSHSILSLLFTGVIFLYIVVRNYPKKRQIIQNLFIPIIGLLLSCFFWVPALAEGKYINSKVFVHDFYQENFVSLDKLIYSPWGFGPAVNEQGGLSPRIGIIPIFLILCCIALFHKQKKKREVIFWFIIFLAGVFMATSFSQIIWRQIHMVQQFQFPWRFTGLSSFVAAVLSMYILALFQRRLWFFLIVLIILVWSIQFVTISGTIKKQDAFYWQYPGAAAFHGEATTIWTDGEAHGFPKKEIQVIAGEATIKKRGKKTQKHTFTVVAKQEVTILDNTVYFPGWKVFIDDEEVPIQFQNPQHPGLITFHVPEGRHTVEVLFTETAVRKFADIISLLSFGGVILLFLISLNDTKRRKA